MKRDDLILYLNSLLDLHGHSDYGPMGLQYAGKEEVNKIATAVSVNQEVIKRAHRLNADFLLVHHGLYWNNEPRLFDARLNGRTKLLNQSKMTLAAYHLSLDANKEFGHSSLLAQYLGLKRLRPFNIGTGGILPEPLTPSQICSALAPYANSPYIFPFGRSPAKKVAIITGSAGHYIHQAVRENYDCFVTGEPEEGSRAIAHELRISYLAIGHDASERIGMHKLGDHLSETFGLEYVFIPTDNPV